MESELKGLSRLEMLLQKSIKLSDEIIESIRLSNPDLKENQVKL